MTDELPEVGPWARDKLDRLRAYLEPYTTIMKEQPWVKGYFYIDGFAGAGQARVRGLDSQPDTLQEVLFDLGSEAHGDAEVREMLDGSPRVALNLKHPFTDYIFVELDPARTAKLDALKAEWEPRINEAFGPSEPPRERIHVRPSDCNAYLLVLVQKPDIVAKNWRGIVFLDPFGMHAPWTTIEALGASGVIEVIVNFPVGMAIQRLLKRSGEFTTDERARLDGYFGDPSWHAVVYRDRPGLFGSQLIKADDAGNRLAAWYRERLRLAFGFASSPYLVRNTRGNPLYYLIHAGPNATGAKIAERVLGSGTRVKMARGKRR